MLIFFSECPGVFVPGVEMNDEDDVKLPFIRFYHYKNIISCYLQKQLLTDHVKTCPSCMNIENFYKVKDTTRKILVL